LETRIIRANRKRLILYSGFCYLFSIAIYYSTDIGYNFSSLFFQIAGIGLALAGTLLLFVTILGQPRLILDKSGISIGSNLYSRKLLWSDCSEFKLINCAIEDDYTLPIVVFKNGLTKKDEVIAIAGMTSEALAQILNEYRRFSISNLNANR